jgi:3-phenylpropionate/cinnamic acid dioxygenase small subunit
MTSSQGLNLKYVDRPVKSVPRPDLVSVVSSFICAEFDMIDEWRLDEWLSLFADECLYWIPIDPSRSPDECISIVCDDHLRLEERLFYLLEAGGASTMPRSRTLHTLGGVQVWEGTSAGELIVSARQVIHEVRLGDYAQVGLGQSRTLPAACEYRLLNAPDTPFGYKIAAKRVELLHRDQPLWNMMFIL